MYLMYVYVYIYKVYHDLLSTAHHKHIFQKCCDYLRQVLLKYISLRYDMCESLNFSTAFSENFAHR